MWNKISVGDVICLAFYSVLRGRLCFPRDQRVQSLQALEGSEKEKQGGAKRRNKEEQNTSGLDINNSTLGLLSNAKKSVESGTQVS